MLHAQGLHADASHHDEKALEWMSRAVANGWPGIASGMDPILDHLRSDPRFDNLLTGAERAVNRAPRTGDAKKR